MSVEAATSRAGKQYGLTGVGVLVRLFLRRDRLRLPLWMAGFGLFVLYIGTAIPAIAPNRDELGSIAVLFTQPVGRMFTGPAYGMDYPSYERFFASGYAPYLFIMAALMSILLVVRHTRDEEQSGRSELIRANVVGRHAPLTAALVMAAISNVFAGVVVTAMSVVVGFAVHGSLIIGVGTALTGMLFGGCAAVTAQFSEFARTASGLAGVALGASFAMRALGDMVAVGGSGMSWSSPLGWPAQVAPYVLDRWSPLGLSAATTFVMVTLAFVLSRRRDFGASLLGVRPGPASAQAFLGSVWGLASRVQRSTFGGWTAGIVVLGVVDGAFMQALLDAGDDMPPAFREVLGTAELADGYISFLGLFITVLITAFTVSAVSVARNEEVRGRADLVLATPVSRTSWLGSHVVYILFAALVIAVGTGIGTGLSVVASTGNWAFFGDVVVAHLALLPAIWFMVGLWTIFMGWLPRLFSPVAWFFVAFTGFVAVFSDMLEVPEAASMLSPVEHLANVPEDEFSALPLVVLLGLTAIALTTGFAGMKRREIATE